MLFYQLSQAGTVFQDGPRLYKEVGDRINSPDRSNGRWNDSAIQTKEFSKSQSPFESKCCSNGSVVQLKSLASLVKLDASCS